MPSQRALDTSFIGSLALSQGIGNVDQVPSRITDKYVVYQAADGLVKVRVEVPTGGGDTMQQNIAINDLQDARERQDALLVPKSDLPTAGRDPDTVGNVAGQGDSNREAWDDWMDENLSDPWSTGGGANQKQKAGAGGGATPWIIGAGLLAGTGVLLAFYNGEPGSVNVGSNSSNKNDTQS